MTTAARPPGALTAARVFRDLLRVPDARTRALVPLVLHAEQARVVGAWDATGADGLPAHDELAILWCKKAGKSATAAGLVLAELVGGRESDREIIIVASDLAQSKDVTYASAARFVRRHPWLAKAITIGASELVYKETRTDARTGGRHVEEHIVRAVPARDAKSLHGSNASLTVFDELWTQGDYAVVEALARSPARLAPRVVYATYAGLKSMARAGVPAWDLWQRWRAGADPRLFVSFVGGPEGWRSIPWITSRLIESERRRFGAVPSKFARLYENTWSHGDEGSFLSAEEIRDATDAALVEPGGPAGHVYSVGVDLGLSNDLAAVALTHVNADGRLVVDVVRTWQGTRQKPVDLVAVERTVLDLGRRFSARVHGDSWQFAMMAQRLARQGLSVQTYTIESSKLDHYATALKGLFRDRLIRVPADPVLVEQLEGLQGEELKRRDKVRFTSGPGAHDDAPMAICLSLESFVHWRVSDGQIRLLSSRLGRQQQAEIKSCRIGGGHWNCPMVTGLSALPGCGSCPAWRSAVDARDAHAATTGRWLSLPGYIQAHMTPCRWLQDELVERVFANL